MSLRPIFISKNNLPSHLLISEKEAQEIIKEKTEAIRTYFSAEGGSASGGKNCGFKKAILGLSGGMDSAFSLALFSQVLGPENIIVVRMPYGDLFLENIKKAEQIAHSLGVPQKNILLIPITEAVEASWQKLKTFKTGNLKVRKGNLMARERMKILFDLSHVFKAVVAGSEDKTESCLGYYTMGGDRVSGIEPFGDLWKTQVYQTASAINKIPNFVLKTPPSPGLWKGQTAEKELGVKYPEIDIILSSFVDLCLDPAEISRRFSAQGGSALGGEINPKAINIVLKQYQIGCAKNKLPYVLPDNFNLKKLAAQAGKECQNLFEKDTKDNEEISILSQELIEHLKQKKIYLGIMESCTGGGLVNAITNIPGASDIIKGALVVYSNEEKIKHGIPGSLIKKYSVYSPEVAVALAYQARNTIESANIGIGITGVLSRIDPKNSVGKIGEVYVSFVFEDKSLVYKLTLPDMTRAEAKKIIIWQTLIKIMQIIRTYPNATNKIIRSVRINS